MSDDVVCDKPYTSTDKWTASIISGLTFLIVSSPYTYSWTNEINRKIAETITGDNDKVVNAVSTTNEDGCPNTQGMIIHSIVYTMIMRIMMEKRNMSGCKKPYTSKDKWVASSIGGLMYLTLSSPILYNLVNSLTTKLGFSVSDDHGCPNVQGLILHTGIFILATRLLMY